MIALPLTLLWLFLVLLSESAPASGPAATSLFLLLLAMMLPAILVLSLAAYFIWRGIRRAGLAETSEMLGARVLALIAFAWLSVTLLWSSQPSVDFLAGMLWLFFTLGIGLTWLAILALIAYRAFKAKGWTVIRRVRIITAYLIPLALTLAVIVPVTSYDLALRARFELSEGALLDAVQNGLPPAECHKGEYMVECEGHLVGLYYIQEAAQVAGCEALQTHSFFGEDGFAYCIGKPVTNSTVTMDHLKGRWWTYSVFGD